MASALSDPFRGKPAHFVCRAGHWCRVERWYGHLGKTSCERAGCKAALMYVPPPKVPATVKLNESLPAIRPFRHGGDAA